MRALLLVMALGVVGCGNGQDGGVACKVNSDCDVGLSCLATAAVGASGACAVTDKKVCTKQCVTDAECLKSAPVCQTSCLGLKTCGTAAK
ncbi:MAG: hypothetical protein H6Q89_4356 [Myxococcaceae bacterium]|nr:hypothetical protein [Myxococcaceae bacterium]